MSVWRFASFQSIVDSVYSIHLPSGLGAGEAIVRICWTSRKVMARLSLLVCAVILETVTTQRRHRDSDTGLKSV